MILNFETKKGISLIALVITIIILLILAGVTLNIVINGDLLNKTENATHIAKLSNYEEMIKLSVSDKKIDKIADKLDTPLKNLVKEELLKQTSWVETVETNEDDVEIKENEIRVITKDNYILVCEILDNGTIIFTEEGKEDGEPYPNIKLEQLPLEGIENEKIKIKVTASVENTKKTKKVEKIILVNSEEEKEYTEEGVIFEVEENGIYTFKAITNKGKSRSKNIEIKVEKVSTNIKIDANVKTPRNTIKTGFQNGVEAGPIIVTIDFGKTELQKQYKLYTEEDWVNVTDQIIEIPVNKNDLIVAKYFDGTNSYRAKTYEIKNIDNEAPTIDSCNATVNGTVITVTASATDNLSEGEDEKNSGIAGYEYSMDGINYYKENTFTIEEPGTYKVYVKAIDLAGNEIIKIVDVEAEGWTITLDKGNGISEVTGKEIILKGTSTTISATLKDEYSFEKWEVIEGKESDIENITSATTKVTPTENIKIKAKAKANEYTITYNLNGGNVTGNPTGYNIETETITLQNPTRTGYTFAGWTGTGLSEASTNVSIAKGSIGNRTYTANWIVNDYTLTVHHYLENINDSNYTLTTTTTTTKSYGTTITLANYTTTIENGTYSYGSLTASTSGGTAATTTTMGTGTTINLYYTRNRFTLTLNKGNYISAVSGAGTYKVGQSVTINTTVATSENGYTNSWNRWTSSNTSLVANTTTQNATITMPASDITLTANGTRTANSYTLTVNHYLENANNTNYSYVTTTYATLQYGAGINYASYATSVANGTYSSGSGSTTMGTGTTIALYYSRNTYTLTLRKGNYISAVSGAGTYKVGQSVTINATVATNENGYTNSWYRWTSSNTSLVANTTTQNATITMPASNITLTANGTRTANNYTLTVNHYLENANDTNYSYVTTTYATLQYGAGINYASYATSVANGTYSSGSGSTTMGTGTTISLYYTRVSLPAITYTLLSNLNCEVIQHSDSYGTISKLRQGNATFTIYVDDFGRGLNTNNSTITCNKSSTGITYDSWKINYIGKNYFLIYINSSTAYGKYDFTVTAINNRGEQSQKTITINIFNENQRFLDDEYKLAFNRTIDEAGQSGWMGVLTNNGPEEVIRGIMGSGEMNTHINNLVNEQYRDGIYYGNTNRAAVYYIYKIALGRPPESATAVDGWAKDVENKGWIGALNLMFTTGEYTNRIGTYQFGN